jgi:hypothetical protein
MTTGVKEGFWGHTLAHAHSCPFTPRIRQIPSLRGPFSLYEYFDASSFMSVTSSFMSVDSHLRDGFYPNTLVDGMGNRNRTNRYATN